jgi:hypothetical protein
MQLFFIDEKRSWVAALQRNVVSQSDRPKLKTIWRQFLPPSRHPQESFGFQRLLIFTTKPQAVAKADSHGCLERVKQNEK